MSTVLDINGNTLRRDGAADNWLRRNRHRLTEATIDGADRPLLMVARDDGACYRVRCDTVTEARQRAARVGLALDVSQRGTDFDADGQVRQ